MTELEAAVLLLSLCKSFDCSQDVAKLARIQTYLKRNDKESNDYQGRFLVTMAAFYKAVVAGLNSRRFCFTFEVLHRKCSFAYPRLFSGLMANIFHQDGVLREDWCRDSAELLLQVLAFFKRVNLKQYRKLADRAAKDEFHAYQTRSRSHSSEVALHLRKLWSEFIRNFERYATLGFAGPGATLDERHPYCPSFSYLDTWDVNLPEDVRQLYDAAFAKHTSFPDSRSWTIHPGDEILPGFYPLVHAPQLRAVTVPKNTQVSRLITVTNVGNTIAGATYRETIKTIWNARGVTHQLNIDNQFLSHQTLRKHFNSVSLFDLEGGSSTFTEKLNDDILPDVFKDFRDTQKGATYPYNGKRYRVNTQLMGDSISVALLTTSLYLSVVLALFYHRYDDVIARINTLYTTCDIWRLSDTFKSEPVQALLTRDMIQSLFNEARDLPINVVGDDVVIPSFLEEKFRYILRSLDISINEKKSSTSVSNHKETCGAWFLREDVGVRQIYPWRFPDSGTSLPEKYQTATAYLQRTRNSTFIVELTCTLSELIGDELSRESYHPSEIGSVVGTGLPASIITRTRPIYSRVSDTTAYCFGLTTADVKTSGSSFVYDHRKPSLRKVSLKGSKACYRPILSRASKHGDPKPRTKFRPYSDPSKPTESFNF